MKRINNLFDKIIDMDNLRRADEKARQHKLHQRAIHRFDRHREENLRQLQQSLINHTFTTSKYRTFKIYDPKERQIYCLPYFPDRILQHAILNVLEPIWYKTLTTNSYSSIKGRGIGKCKKAVHKGMKEFDPDKPLYCLKIDIKKYYPSIDHEILKGIVRRKIKDKDVLWLLDDIIDSADGLPIGNYISQYLANLYLAYFMHYANERMPYQVMERLGLTAKPKIRAYEYADDMVFLCADKAVLHECLTLIKAYMETHLKLKVKDNYQVYPIPNRRSEPGRGLDFVGFVFYRAQTLIRKSIKKGLCRQVAKLNRYAHSTNAYKMALGSRLGWCVHSDSINLLKTILNPQHHEIIYQLKRA